jgi:hypothetical protein
MTNYISFSLFGTLPIYVTGAIENVKLSREFYPDWTPIVYVDDEVTEQVMKELEVNGGQVVKGSTLLSKNKRAWRFAAALIEDANLVILRDADSRVNSRERACVEKWMASGRALHIMRDHPFHSSWIMAGMWGIHAKTGGPFVSKILSKATGRTDSEDQDLLASELYPHLCQNSLVHDSFFKRESWALPFPTPRTGSEFVGERIGEDGTPEKDISRTLVRYEKSKALRLKLKARDFLRTKFEQKL